MLVAVWRNLQGNTLVHRVETGHAVDLWASDLVYGQATLIGDGDGFFDAVIHFDSQRNEQRGCRNLGAKGLEHRVAAR